jgi:hypothetical protein
LRTFYVSTTGLAPVTTIVSSSAEALGMLIVAPARVPGGTGSPTNPIAVF